MCMDFATRLKELRQSRHMTQAKLASALHYGNSAIANYESGRNTPRMYDLIRIADFFHVSIDYMVGREQRELTLEQKKLLYGYACANDKQRKLLVDMVNDYLNEKERK